jgi:hypothetical protein
MTRSGYSDDLDHGAMNCWRANVRRTINGKRGQAFLGDMLEALDAMPEKKLVSSVLVEDGACCAMGAVAVKRELDTTGVDPYDRDQVANLLKISGVMAAEIAFENDGDFRHGVETPEQRWIYMREWVVKNMRTP